MNEYVTSQVHLFSYHIPTLLKAFLKNKLFSQKFSPGNDLRLKIAENNHKINNTKEIILFVSSLLFITYTYYFIYVDYVDSVIAQLAGVQEYVDCISTERQDASNKWPRYDTKLPDGEDPVLKLLRMGSTLH